MTEGGTYSFNDSNVPYGTFMVVWSTRQFSFDVSNVSNALGSFDFGREDLTLSHAVCWPRLDPSELVLATCAR